VVGRGIDLGLAGQQIAVAVDDAHLVLLGEPPGDLLLEQAIERIHGEQGAAILAVVEDRHVDLELGCLRVR
jgi:hypothetical protein